MLVIYCFHAQNKDAISFLLKDETEADKLKVEECQQTK